MEDGTITQDMKEIANIFYNHYMQMGKNLAQELKQPR